MNNIKLSVIIPVYNAEKYIENTVGSLIADGKDYEIILIDDHSKDNSAVMCDALGGKYDNIQVVHKLRNEGLSMARNTGIQVARGKYICFVDADDKFAEKDAIRKIIISCQNDKDIYFLNMEKEYSDGRRISINNFYSKIKPNMREDEICEIIANEKSAPVSASTKIIKKDTLIKNDLLFKPGILSEDIEWFFRVIQSGIMNSCDYIDVTYLYYQGNSESITRNISEKNISDMLDILEGISDFAYSCNDCRARCIRRMAAFEAMITIYSWGQLNKAERKRMRRRIHGAVKLMKYTKDIRVKSAYLCSKVFGVGVTARLLAVARG